MRLKTWFVVSATAFLMAECLVMAQSNGLLREVYMGISGANVSDLTNNASFPDNPTSENIVTDFFESPTDIAENYGQRMRAQIVPPTTGSYYFWISSDDASTLYLSTDDTPANRRAIAWVSSWTPPRVWTSEGNQKSAAIPLNAGQKYYIEALMKEAGGGDNLAVRWQLPNGTMEEPIPASRLLVYGMGPPVITQQPTNVSAVEGGTAVFSVKVSRTSGMTYQWWRDGASIPGATAATYLLSPVALSDNGSRFQCQLVNGQGSTNSIEAVLTVLSDTTAPTLLSVANLGDAQFLSLLFSEPIDEASALQTDHYAIDGGVTVQSANFAGNTRTIVLKTSPLEFGKQYTLTLNGLTDRATNPNAMAPNTQRTFKLDYQPLDVSVVTGKREPLGPSNRRSGLVISEIMYHPAARSDGKNLQYVELFNSYDWPEDISGYRLSGSIDYTFPANTVIPKRSFLVVAPVPEDIRAIYGINNVVGGFPDNLPNDKGTIRLRSRNDAVYAEARYASQPPYPEAANGAGHSLVLARPSYGEASSLAWMASELVGGSPGVAEPAANNPYRTVLINEFLAHTVFPAVDYIELYNYGAQPVNLSGCGLTDDPTTNKFSIPEGTTIPACGFVVFDQNQLGFGLNSSGEAVYLFNPDRTRVLDAIQFGPQANGIARGRYPDGAPDFYELAAPTPGTANRGRLGRDIVINEIMYKPISGDNNDEYIELYNAGTNTVDLGGWRFTAGIDYTFPANSVLGAGAYLVVAKNAAHLETNYANLTAANTLGDFKGSLANGGERIALAMPEEVWITNIDHSVTAKWQYVVVSEATYGRGGRWGTWANGGGSSLELIDARSDNHLAANWADSDESLKAPWTTVEYTSVLDNGGGGYQADQLQVLLQGAGECLVDDVEVFKAGGPNRIANPGFENGLAGWVRQGNHNGSFLENTGGVNNSHCLHVMASGRGDTGANRIRVPLTSTLNAGETATIRAKVRWLKGSAEILLRLHGNWLEAVGNLNTPANPGTPGTVNSRRVANAGPAIYNVTHTPVLPAANQAVVVSAQVSDPDGLASLVLNYRVDPATNYTAVGMVYNGAGLYSATIPGQRAGVGVAFYLQASDAAAASGGTRFPNDAPAREGLVFFGEPQPSGNFGTYHLWLSQNSVNLWSSREKLNNAPIDGTFVYGNQRVVYNMGALYAGSPFLAPGYNSPVGGLCGYVLVFPEDDLLLGSTDFVLDWPIRDGTGQLEQIAFWMLDQLGNQNVYRRFINLYVNGGRRGAIYEDCLQPNADVVQEWSENDTDGDLFKIDDWFEFDDAGSGFSNTDATLQNFTTTGGVKKRARYRWNWRKRAVKGSASDYQSLFTLVDALNTTGTDAYTAKVEALVDVDQWMRAFAIEHIVINWDSYGFQRGKNMYAYKPANGRWSMWPWDIDFLFSAQGDPNQDNLFSAGDPTMQRMYSHPPFQRAYYRAIYDAANGPMVSTRINAKMDANYAALTANGVSVAAPDGEKTWIAQRRNFLLQKLNAVAANFAVTSNQGRNFSTNKTAITVTGTAPVGIQTITVNGIKYPVKWTSVTGWSIQLALSPGDNNLTFEGWDHWGNLYDNALASLTVTYTGTPELPQEHVVINEIMYHPSVAKAGFIELFNNSTITTFDLSNWRLKGADFTFPDGTLVGPQGYLVIAEDKAVFAATYGANIAVVGAFAGQLDNGGERLTLIKPGATPADDVVVDAVRYDNNSPWPANADGLGSSLQLIDANQDRRRVANWAAAATNAPVRYTPGAANSVRATLPSFPLLWLNEAQPENITGPTDQAGHREPWIELYNAGTSAVDLSGFYLTDYYTNLTQWAFPADTVLNPQSFLMVWVDGASQETTATELHTNFRITPGSGNALLVWTPNQQPVVYDYLNYQYVSAGRSYGDFPDGQPLDRQLFHYPTPGGTNDPTSMPVSVVINEWMAANTRTLADPVDGKYDDWFELYNAGTNTVDLTGYALTDALTNRTQFIVPEGTTMSPGGFLLVWADGEPGQNSISNGDLHVNFKLSQTGESIGLYAPDGTLVDAVTFGAQTNDVSQGRWPDGAPEPFNWMELPSPRDPNVLASSNLPPALASLADLTVDEGSLATFTARASDPNSDQSLSFSLGPGAPVGATLEPATGVFTWTPNEAQGPGAYPIIVRVTDNGLPPLSSLQRVTINVGEVNTAPGLTAIADQTVAEEQPISFQVTATDADLPAQQLTYSLEVGAPVGATIDPTTGRFDWTPSEAQGPGAYAITVKVTDSGTPALSDKKTFTITVQEVNAAPVIALIPDQVVIIGETLNFTVRATDPDIPTQNLTYRLDAGAPAGAIIEAGTGLFTWAPSADQVPSTNYVTVRVTDNGTPEREAAQVVRIIAGKPNHAPTMAALADQVIDEEALLTVAASASDSDPGQALTYSLDPGAPTGATIDPTTGVFRWTPSEAQGPATNIISIRVTDDGVPSMSATQTLRVVVREVNQAPVLTAIDDQTVTVGQTLNLPLSASDADLPANKLTYRVDAGAPAGLTVAAATGVLSWAPGANQAPSTNVVTVRVRDDGTPPLEATRTFWIIVREEPVWQYVAVTGTASSSVFYIYLNTPGEVYLDDLKIVAGDQAEVGDNKVANGDFESALSGPWTVSPNHAASTVVTNTAHSGRSSLHVVASTGGTTRDSSIYQTITPALTSGAAYTLSYWYKPGTNATALTLRLSGFGIQSTNSIAPPTNRPPVLMEVDDQVLVAGQPWTLAAIATDPDAGQRLTYAWEGSVPSGMSIDAVTGEMTWTPPTAQGATTNRITVRATDNGSPALNAIQSFTLTVQPAVEAPHLTEIVAGLDGRVTLTWSVQAGGVYQVQYKHHLNDTEWTDLGSPINADGASATWTDTRPSDSECFYRVEISTKR